MSGLLLVSPVAFQPAPPKGRCFREHMDSHLTTWLGFLSRVGGIDGQDLVGSGLENCQDLVGSGRL